MSYKLDDPKLIDEIIRASQASPCAVDPIKDRAAFDALPRERQIELQETFIE